MTDREQFELICDLTTEMVGLQQGSLAFNTRKQEVLIPRMVASVIGIMAKDIHVTVIADIIKKDRTSVLHYKNSHKSNYASFPYYRNIFNKVYNAYTESEKIKIVLSSRDEICRLLIDAGIKISAKPQVKIKITSGKAKYMLPTTYLEFSNNINIIKHAFREVDYSTEIITL